MSPTRLDTINDPATHHTYDHGLAHDHHWAKDRAPQAHRFPTVANAARATTPSSAFHDDIHYAP